VVSDPGPGDGMSWVSLNPVLSVDVLDLHGDPVSVTFRTNASGVWRDIGVVSGDSGVFELKSRWMLERGGSVYWWSVNVSDGLGWWTNKSFSLTLVPYKGQRVMPVAKGYCWKFPDVRPAVEKGIYYENSMMGGGGRSMILIMVG